MNQTIELASDDLLLLGERATTERQVPLVVVFSSDVADGVKNAPCFASRTLRAVNVHQLHVMARRRHAWQTPEMARVFVTARAYAESVGARSLLTLGASVGGFGALLFAPALGASRVLAFSPQWTVNLRRLRFDPRWRWPLFGEDARNLQALVDADGNLPHDDMKTSLAALIDRYIVFDSQIPDAAHARKMRGPHTELYGLPHASHAVPRFLREVDCFEPLLAAFTAGHPPAMIAALQRARRQRWESSLFRAHLLADRAFARRHPERHLRTLLAQVEIRPDLLALRRALVEQYLVLGDSGKAMQAATDASLALVDAPPAIVLFEQARRVVSSPA